MVALISLNICKGMGNMTITTSQNIEGKQISKYLGIVSAALVAALPGGNKATQRGWKAGVDGACQILEQQAKDLGADAVIAVQMQMIGSNLCAIGTAVNLST
jgi:uncharacterized protein YbjQ (UPF0145 family)